MREEERGVLANAIREIIRPWRIYYTTGELGAERQAHRRGTLARQDHEVVNRRQ
jgi:hypothetical protein